jgi:hypothetical protein
MSQAEIIIYQRDNKLIKLEVQLKDETVWLTQAQIAELFGTKRPAITKHLINIYKSGELNEDSTCSILEHMSAGGIQKYKTKYYNLDVILSVGYRVNSINATRFRIWANHVLKEYLLKGYAVNQRLNKVEDQVSLLNTKVNEIDFQIKTTLPPLEGIFYDGQIFDAWEFVSKLIKSAKKDIILFDNYIDESVLNLLTKRGKKVTATIYTAKVNPQLKTDIEKYNSQYPPVKVIVFKKVHDRFLIIDKKTIYHIGASLKDLGKKWFAFSKINLNPEEIMRKLEK